MKETSLPISDPAKGLGRRAKNPVIGAVIPSRNRYAKTSRFLDTFLKQTYADLRVYVVDSNSSDSTADYIGQGNDGIILLSATDDDFWSGATNVGVRRALDDGCEYILTINDDSVIEGDLVEKLVDVACRYDLKILASRVDHLDEMGQIWSIGAYNCWGSHQLFYLRGYLEYEDECPEILSGQEIIETELTPGNGVLVHRSVFEKIGLYDAEWCPHYHGDSEIILRAREHGFRCFVALHTVVYNDVDNPSGNSDVINPPDPFDVLPRPLRRLAFPLEKLYRLFWQRRSDRRFPTIYHIVMRYAPPHLRLRTLLLYFSASLWIFYGQRMLPLRYARFIRRAAGDSRRLSWRSLHPAKVLALLKGCVIFAVGATRSIYARIRNNQDNRKMANLFIEQFK
jgi:GT2 family glycosyltransferase